MSLNCNCCGARMRDLFTSTYCPNDCDKPLLALPAHPPGRTPMPGPYGPAMFKQSWLWAQVGPTHRSLSCPYCMLNGHQINLVCGDIRSDSTFDATCKGSGDGMHHTITVMDDEVP